VRHWGFKTFSLYVRLLRAMGTLVGFMMSVLILLSASYAADIDAHSGETHFYANELLEIVNQYRTSNRLRPLSEDKKLTDLAKNHSTEMHSRRVLNHDNFEERFTESKRDYCIENVGWNYRSARAQFIAWQESEGHNKNMLAQRIRNVGISRIGAFVTFFACD